MAHFHRGLDFARRVAAHSARVVQGKEGNDVGRSIWMSDRQRDMRLTNGRGFWRKREWTPSYPPARPPLEPRPARSDQGRAHGVAGPRSVASLSEGKGPDADRAASLPSPLVLVGDRVDAARHLGALLVVLLERLVERHSGIGTERQLRLTAGDAEAVSPVALLDAGHVELEPRRALDAVAAGLPIETAERALGDQGLGRGRGHFWAGPFSFGGNRASEGRSTLKIGSSTRSRPR